MNFLNTEDVYKFIDDGSFIEIINLVSTGLSSYNFKQQVASDISHNNLFLPPENIESNRHLQTISEWTKQNQMQLNTQKTKYMIFNF